MEVPEGRHGDPGEQIPVTPWHWLPQHISVIRQENLKVIGITGTKGKTTTTYMVKSILESAGHKVGLIGTIEAIIGEEHIPANNTTPESLLIQEYFAEDGRCRLRQCGDGSLLSGADACTGQPDLLLRSVFLPTSAWIISDLHEHKDFEDYAACKGTAV